MRKSILLMSLVCVVSLSWSQDFTNKGKEFWLGYGNHQQMYDPNRANQPGMDVYVTSDVDTEITLELPGLGISQTYMIFANQLRQITITSSAFLDTEGTFDKGIHITALKPVVVYAHIYYASVSGASLCLPVATLGREYYAVNFKQEAQANITNAWSWFFVVATEDNTEIEVTPSANTHTMTAGQTYTRTLQKGQVFNVLSATDLTGSVIKSVNNGTGCKKIAVFCGSGRIGIGCPTGGVGSSDNLFQQMYPNSTWGKKYLTVPSSTRPLNYYRIIRPDASAVVKRDGAIIPAGSFTNNFYFDFSDANPHVIESDKPILVAQYFTTQDCAEITSNGDPEMIYLSPVEQTVNKVTVASMRLISSARNMHFINAVVKNNPGAINSFRIDGVSYATRFVQHPTDAAYAYAQIGVSGPSAHTITCDTPFNATAYGFGGFESYGYSAGSNLKDLYQFVSLQNPYAVVHFPASCKSTPFRLAMTFPYQPTEIKWIFGATLNAAGIADVTITSPVADSTWVVDGRTLYRYRLPGFYSINLPGTYPIIVKANNPTADGCNGEQQIDYDLEIFDRPKADFSFAAKCLGDPVTFTDKIDGLGRSVTKWFWDLKDGNTSTLQNVTHNYAAAGLYKVAHWGITDVGCLSDTMEKNVELSQLPVAGFGISPVHCEDTLITFTNQSTVVGGTLAKWTWDFGDNTVSTTANGDPLTHAYANTGTYTASLVVETTFGCKSTAFQLPITIHPKPVVDFSLPGNVCLPAGTASFNSLSTIADGTQNLFTYAWDFGDGQTAAVSNPVYQYTGVGPYDVKLTVISNNQCAGSRVKTVNTIYPRPKADFDVSGEVCLAAPIQFTDKSDGKGSTVTQWRWDFGNTQTATQQNNTVTYATADTFDVQLSIVTDKGCISDTVTKQAIVHPLPVAAFTFSAPTCEGAAVNFTDASTPNAGTLAKWQWSFGNGNTSTSQNPATTYATVNTYTASLVVESSKGCVSPAASQSIAVHPMPVPDFTSPEVCLLDAAQFTSTSTIADNSEAQFRYSWNFGDGGTSTQSSPQHPYGTAGDYQVSLTITSKDGCAKSITHPFTVNGDVRRSAFAVDNAASLCVNKEVLVRDNSEVVSGKLVKVEIYWDYTGDPTVKTVDDDPAIGKSYTHKYPDFGTPATRAYQVRYIAYSGENCFKTDVQTLTLKASPVVEFTALQAVCEEVAPFPVNTAREIFGFSGTGSFSGPGISPDGTFNPGAAKPGLHTLRYDFMAGNGCTAFNEQTIRVYPTPVVNAGADKGVLEGGFVLLDGRATGSGLQYQWTPNTAMDDATKPTPRVSPTEDITYTLTVVSGDGCTDSDDVFVRVLKALVVPNTFTPNGDKINDTWKILYLESYPGCTVDVYNRYGQRVFTSIGYGREWDGTVNGNPLPIGTYYWIINPKNGRPQMNGSVTIVR
jgi:gliding motility-associated-like protein